MAEDPSDLEFEDTLGDLDDFFDEEPLDIDKTEILIIGRNIIHEVIRDVVNDDIYDIYSVDDLTQAAELLLNHYFTIIFIDSVSNMDPASLSNMLRNNHALARIILIYEGNDFSSVAEIFNEGSIDGIISFPPNKNKIQKVIVEQEAKYQIQKEVTNFVSDPPKLSKANFLLLDPSLSFGDEDTPLNFVGVMIVVNSVPKYDIFFEETLKQDEVLFAAFLSSISSMGDTLFQSEESLKEINFGGISVIFRFIDEIQFAFLVKNLNRHNFEKAEDRIDNIINTVMEEYGELLTSRALDNMKLEELDGIFKKFDMEDQLELEKYDQKKEQMARKEFGTPTVIFVANPPKILSELEKETKAISNTVGKEFNVISVHDDNEASILIDNRNVVVILIDQSVFEGKSGVFILESVEELDPSVQKIYLSHTDELTEKELELINTGNLDFVHTRSTDRTIIIETIQTAVTESLKIKSEKAKGALSSQSKSGLSAAKAMLKENLEDFDAAVKPELQGVVIAQDLEPIFDRFFEVDGTIIDFDVELMTGLVTSLKQISGEMFSQESVDGLEVAGHNVFVRFNANFMFLYFISKINPNTSVLVSKELDAITALFSEVISESLGVLSAEDLKPIFNKISERAQQSLTELLVEK